MEMSLANDSVQIPYSRYGMVNRTISGGYMVEGKEPRAVYLASNDDFSVGFF